MTGHDKVQHYSKTLTVTLVVILVKVNETKRKLKTEAKSYFFLLLYSVFFHLQIIAFYHKTKKKKIGKLYLREKIKKFMLCFKSKKVNVLHVELEI